MPWSPRPQGADGVRAVRDVRARWNGHRLETELVAVVDPALEVARSAQIVDAVVDRLRQALPHLDRIVVRITGASASADADGAGQGRP